MMGFSYEKRALKRPRLGPPDVYPQEPKQKEDELTTINVKHGFATMPQLTDEFGTARNCNITASKVGAYFNAILTKKEELNTLPDTGRKRQQINPKDNFWPATARTKTAIEAWFKDLAGSKPLSILSKKAPNFNKKEDIFMMLCEYQVPMLRAAWFIKLSYAYTVAVSEVKIKKRQLPDPSQEWTATLIKFLKDQLNKLQDYYHQSNNSNSGSNSTPSNSNTSTGTPTPATTNITTTNTTLTTTAAGIQPQISTPSGNTPQHPGASPAPVPQVPAMTEEQKLAHKQWHYCVQLAKYLYEEGLLERQEFLQWILELLDKMRSSPADDGILKLLLPLALQYLDEFVQSELLARKLAYLCAKKLSQLCSAASEMSTNTTASSGLAPGASPQSPLIAPNSVNVLAPAVPVNPLVVTFNEYMTCPHHRDLVLGLSAILQAITLECPTALVWNCVGEGKSPSVLNGSPLDHLPCAPSTLPMPQRANNPAVRRQLRAAEEHIRQRSRAAEGRWSCDKWQQSSAGRTTTKVLTALDALDRHSFDRMDATNSLDTLYAKIFSPPGTKESAASGTAVNSCANSNVTANGSTGTNGAEMSRDTRADYTLMQDEAVVQILCEWAVSSQRSGEHRAMAVAKLLEKRQSDLLSGDSDTADEKDSVSSANGAPTGLPVFQPLLMRFLDNDAPVLEDNPSPQNRAMFTNLVHLFSELIRHDIFSHDVYMCTLISRGDLNTGGPAAAGGAATPHHPTSNKPATPADSRGPVVSNPSLQDDDGSLFPGIDLKPTKLEVPDHGRNMDYDDSKIDDDLDKLLQHIKEEQQNSMDAPDSPKDDGVPPGSLVAPPMASVTPMEGVETAGSGETRSRHLLYTTHFPLPQDEPCSLHDCNQRHVLLYGVGKVRDEARHTVKKMTKEICKLFSKKFSIDVAEGGKVKKHSRGEFNFEATTAKVQGLSYFDQHVVTWQCAMTVVEMMNSFASGNSNYLPVQEHVAFLFDLMELALSIYGLIDVCIQILKELPEVEAQLQAKGSGLVRSYTTSLSLYVVGVLRRYHCCLLLFPEQTTLVFEGLCRVVKHVTNPGDCSSAERCVLAHLYDLYSSCSLLKSKPHCVEPFGNAYPKIRQALYSSLQPSSSNHVCNAQFMAEVFSSPRRGGKIEPQWARQLAETPNNRYSFVCNAVVAVCNETDNDRLNDLAILCAELTACCNALSAEWLGVLMALCCSSNHSSHFIDVLAQVDVQDLSIHNSLAVFTSILIARHCFSLEDFVVHIALPSLVKACNEGRGDADIEAEAGARLTCHLLLRLFKTVECPQPALYSVGTSPHPVPNAVSPGYSIKLSCDRHLLAAAHNNIRVGPVLAVLKAILVVGDATARDGKPPSSKSKTEQSQQLHTSSSGNGNKPPISGSASGELSISHILGTSDILGGGDDPLLDLAVVDMEPTTRAAQRAITSSVSNATGTIENAAGLSDFAQHVLRQICSQEWVLERCLQNPEELCHPDMLLDSMLTPKQAQRLLHMICYPDTTASNEEFLDQRQIIARILENLDQWTLRMSWLDLQLMFTQFPPGSAELNQWLDTVAKAAIDVFQLTNSGGGGGGDSKEEKRGGKPGSIWLVAPLVSKLPSAVQGRVLKVAGQVLESGNWSSKNRDKERNVQRSSSLLSHQPFLSLVLTCLKGQDDQREGLLTSLHSQLSQFLCLSKDERLSNYEDIKGRALMQDALQLRFSLVGGMFDTIQRNTTVTTDWAILLVQLISYVVIDLNNNSELFTTVIDMLGTLIHSTLVSDSQSEKEENRKHYQNLMKKLKKELGDRTSPSIQHVRQLLPLPKVMAEVVVCQPMGCLTDTKGNKIAGFDSIDKKQGLQVFEKQRVSPWDLLEGHKNPAPLSWSWFGAIRMERKPLWYEDTHRLLKYHTHSLLKSPNYFLDMPPLPPEDLEPPQEKPLKDDGKADTPNSSDQSPRGPGGSKRVKAQRRRRTKGGAPGGPANGQPVMPGLPQQVQQQQQPQPPVQHMAYPNQGGMFPAQAQWGGYGQQQQQPPQQQQQQQQQPPPQQPQPQPQQGYYPSQQLPAVGPPRYERPINQSKQALSQMLRMRMPGNQFMGGQPPGFPQGMQRQQFIRQQLRASHGGPGMQPPPQQGMFSQQQGAPMYANMQQGMNQNYGGYGGQPGPQMVPQQQLMGQGGQAMMGGFPGQQGGGFVPQQQPPPGMMGTGGPMPPQQPRGAGGPADYMGPQSAMSAQQQRAMAQQGARPPYLQAPNVTMTTMGGPMGQQGQGQPQPAPPYGRAGAGAQGPPPTHASQQQQQNQQFQQRMRQMLVMQQQQQQQQGPNQQGNQQPQTALVAQLQRTLSQQQQPGGNPQAQQHNPYTHQGHQPPPY